MYMYMYVSSKCDAFTVLCSGLRRSQSLLSSTIEEQFEVGDRVVVGGQRRGVIRYSGTTDFAPGIKQTRLHCVTVQH